MTEEKPITGSFLTSVVNRCGSYLKSVNTLGRMKKFTEKLKGKKRGSKSDPGKGLTLEGTELAEDWEIKEMQLGSFPLKVKNIRGNNPVCTS